MSCKLTKEEVEEGVKTLVDCGLVEDSGERRNGKVVWTLTEKGRDPIYADQVLNALADAEDEPEGEPN